MQKLIDKLPFDVIINHILPYIYNPQPNNLLIDIRSYYADYKLVESVYMTQHNEWILLHDLKKCCCVYLKPYYGIDNKFKKILRRHFIIANQSEENLINIIKRNFHRNIIYVEKKIKIIWALLTPAERTEFINNFILIDDDF
jgi:hypothetical protein